MNQLFIHTQAAHLQKLMGTDARRRGAERGAGAIPAEQAPRTRHAAAVTMHALHRTLFALALLAWTWALVSPNPVPEAVKKELPADWEFVLAKCLHAGAYAFLAVLGGTMLRSGRWRLAGLMALHGVGTEVAQWAMHVGRHGCVRDVLIDWAGIAAGLAALKWWNREHGRP